MAVHWNLTDSDPPSSNRLMARLRLRNPSDRASYVDITVLMQLPIGNKDEKSSGIANQHVYGFDNSADSGRFFHCFRVLNTSGKANAPVYDPYNWIEVERIECWPNISPKEDHAVHGWLTGNTDLPGGWPAQPGDLIDPDTTFYRTVVRCTADNTADGHPWVDIEVITFRRMIDRKKSTDPRHGQPQERAWRVPWFTDPPPSVGDTDDPYNPRLMNVDKTLPLLDARTGLDFTGINDNSKKRGGAHRQFTAGRYPLPMTFYSGGAQNAVPGDSFWPTWPYRLDPFQNIVNVDFGGPFLILDFTLNGTNGDDASLIASKFSAPAAPTADPPLVAFPPDSGFSNFVSGPILWQVKADPDLVLSNSISRRMRKDLGIIPLPFFSTAPGEKTWLISLVVDGETTFINFTGTSSALAARLAQYNNDQVDAAVVEQLDFATYIGEEHVDNTYSYAFDADTNLIETTDSAGHTKAHWINAINLSRWLPKVGPGDPPFTGNIVFTVHVPQSFVQEQSFFYTIEGFFNSDHSGFFTDGTLTLSPAAAEAEFEYLLGAVAARDVSITNTTFVQTTFRPQTSQAWSLAASTYATRNNFPVNQAGAPQWDIASAEATAQASGAGGNVEGNWSIGADGIEFGASDPGKDYTITVSFPSLKVTISS